MNDKPSKTDEEMDEPKKFEELTNEEILSLVLTTNLNVIVLHQLYKRLDSNDFDVSIDTIFRFLEPIGMTGTSSKRERGLYARIVQWLGHKILSVGDNEIAESIIRHYSLRIGTFIFEYVLSFLDSQRITNIIELLKKEENLRTWDFERMLKTIREFQSSRLSGKEF